MSTLREVIDAILKDKGWTQEDLGKKIGASQSRVSKMRFGPDWEEHWKILSKVADLIIEGKHGTTVFEAKSGRGKVKGKAPTRKGRKKRDKV